MAQKKRIALKVVKILEPRFASAITQIEGLIKRNFKDTAAVELYAEKGAEVLRMVVHDDSGDTQEVLIEMVGATLVIKP